MAEQKEPFLRTQQAQIQTGGPLEEAGQSYRKTGQCGYLALKQQQDDWAKKQAEKDELNQ